MKQLIVVLFVTSLGTTVQAEQGDADDRALIETYSIQLRVKGPDKGIVPAASDTYTPCQPSAPETALGQ
ncbi:hypothetical protein [Paraburkholderia graminis]|uniref:hypothetical protein n=1 Tax=Paraburkholderia graminis TaxID=60548 RepID=UPI0038BD6196